MRTVGDFERFAAEHPWLAALPFSIVAGVVCSIITLMTGGPNGGIHVGIPVCAVSWILLGSRLRLGALGGG